MSKRIILPILALVVILAILGWALGWFTQTQPDLPQVPETTQEGDMPLTPEGEEEPLPDTGTAPAPAQTDTGTAPAPAPTETDTGTAPAPVPAQTDTGTEPTPAPTQN